VKWQKASLEEIKFFLTVIIHVWYKINLPSNHSTAFRDCVAAALGLLSGCQPKPANLKQNVDIRMIPLYKNS
jgi:hypothetical protein